MMFSTPKIAKIGVFVALAIALNLVLLPIPNVELISFVVFSSGYLLGVTEGGMVGLLAMFLYSVFNPMGIPPLPILMAQVISMALIGASGGMVARLRWLSGAKIVGFLVVGLAGLVLTLVYDLLTNLAVAYMAGQLIPVLVGGAFFSLIHIVSNTIIFTALSPAIYLVREVTS